MTDVVNPCPKCGSTDLAVEVKTWMNFLDGEPTSFDEEDIDSSEPIDGGEIICRDCQHIYHVGGTPVAPTRRALARERGWELQQVCIGGATEMNGWQAYRVRPGEGTDYGGLCETEEQAWNDACEYDGLASA